MLTETNWVGLTLDNRYVIRAKLGEGGMAFVYRARDRRLSCDVVIKVPRATMLQEPGFAARFQREIQSLVELVHPHIVRLTDTGEHDGLPYAVLQYLPGGSLADRHSQSPEALSGWLPHVAAALDFIHKQGYLHRDVKPPNILFDAHGNPYLSDFGVAKIVSAAASEYLSGSMTTAGIVLGTPQYLAPELIMGRPADGRADQYSLAITVHEMLSGQRPFDGPTPAAVLVRQTTENPPSLHDIVPTLPQGLCAIILRALSKDPDRRFVNCTTFAAAVLAATGQAAASAAGGVAAPTASIAKPTGTEPPPGVFCPSCGKAVLVPAEARGKRLRCRACQTVFRAGSVIQATADTAVSAVQTPSTRGGEVETQAVKQNQPPAPTMLAPAPDTDRAYAPTPPTSRRKIRLLGSAAAFLVLAAAGVAAIVYLLSQKETREDKPARQIISADAKAVPAGVDEQPRFNRFRRYPGGVPHIPPQPTVAIASVSEVTVAAGMTADVRVNVRYRNWDQPIDVEVRRLPQALTVVPDKLSIRPGDTSVTFNLRASENAPLGTGVATVLVHAGRLTDGQELHWTVTQPVYSFRLKTSSITIAGGQTLLVDVAADRGNYKGPIPIHVASLPAGVECEPLTIPRGSSRGQLKLTAVRAVEDATGVAYLWSGDQEPPPSPATVFHIDRRTYRLPAGVAPLAVTVQEWTGELARLTGHHGEIQSLIYCTDGRLISGGEDKRIMVWGKHIPPGTRPITLEGHTGAITSLCLSSSDEWLLSGASDGAIRRWSLGTHELDKEFKGHKGAVWFICYSGPMQMAAVSYGADGKAFSWNLKTGKSKLPPRRQTLSPMLCDPEGKLAVKGLGTGHPEFIKLITTDKTDLFQRREEILWESLGELPHDAVVRCAAFNVGLTKIFTYAMDHKIRVWAVAEGRRHAANAQLTLVRTIDGPPDATIVSIAASPDGDHLALGASDGAIYVWKLPSKSLGR